LFNQSAKTWNISIEVITNWIAKQIQKMT